MPSWKFFDTLKWARRYRPDLPRHSLQFLREAYKIPENNAHRALDDVIVLHQVFNYLIDDIDIETACTLLNKPRTLQHVPFGKHRGKPLKDIPRDYVQWMSTSGAFAKPENQDLKTAFIQLNLLTPQAA
jgi:DNA polymerase-3 subunit epsilon